METKYNPKEIEARWYQYWQDNKLFHSEPDSRDPFTIVIPPPNVTGVLHMGHVLNETIQDMHRPCFYCNGGKSHQTPQGARHQ